MNDLMHYAHQIPTIPVARTMDVSCLVELRARICPRPSWTAVLLKSYCQVARQHAALRRTYVRWPWPHFYEHPDNIAGVAIEKEYGDERIVLAAQVRNPELRSLTELAAILQRYKTQPVREIGYYRMALRLGRLPLPLRRFLWWSTLNMSGYKKVKRLGTMGITSYGRLGAEQLHPLGPLTTTLTFGPISSQGSVTVRVVYDHRTLDGAEVARFLGEMEQNLHRDIRCEMEQLVDSAQSELVA